MSRVYRCKQAIRVLVQISPTVASGTAAGIGDAPPPVLACQLKPRTTIMNANIMGTAVCADDVANIQATMIAEQKGSKRKKESGGSRWRKEPPAKAYHKS